MIQLKKGRARQIQGFVQLDGPDLSREVTVEIPEIKFKQTVISDENGFAAIDFKTKNLELWSPENPKLYEVAITASESRVKDWIGFRTIETKSGN